jgi:hypothetical protein
MPRRRSPLAAAGNLAAESMQLAAAVPPVMAHRLTRMALAGPTLSARDRREFTGMFAEKPLAFAQGWQAMAWQALRVQQELAWSMWRACMPFAWGAGPWRSVTQQAQGAALGLMGQAMGPVRRKAVANAKRLARTPLR